MWIWGTLAIAVVLLGVVLTLATRGQAPPARREPGRDVVAPGDE